MGLRDRSRWPPGSGLLIAIGWPCCSSHTRQCYCSLTMEFVVSWFYCYEIFGVSLALGSLSRGGGDRSGLPGIPRLSCGTYRDPPSAWGHQPEALIDRRGARKTSGTPFYSNTRVRKNSDIQPSPNPNHPDRPPHADRGYFCDRLMHHHRFSSF